MLDVDKYVAAVFSGWATHRLTAPRSGLEYAQALFIRPRTLSSAYDIERLTFAALFAVTRKMGEDRRYWPGSVQSAWSDAWGTL